MHSTWQGILQLWDILHTLHFLNDWFLALVDSPKCSLEAVGSSLYPSNTCGSTSLGEVAHCDLSKFTLSSLMCNFWDTGSQSRPSLVPVLSWHGFLFAFNSFFCIKNIEYLLLVFTKSEDNNFRAFWLAPVTRNILGYSLFCERKEKGRVVSWKFQKKKLKQHFFIHLIW